MKPSHQAALAVKDHTCNLSKAFRFQDRHYGVQLHSYITAIEHVIEATQETELFLKMLGGDTADLRAVFGGVVEYFTQTYGAPL